MTAAEVQHLSLVPRRSRFINVYQGGNPKQHIDDVLLVGRFSNDHLEIAGDISIHMLLARNRLIFAGFKHSVHPSLPLLAAGAALVTERLATRNLPIDNSFRE
jgi:hypothetical protein